MKAYCLASSSAGNCYILQFDINGVPTQIMVECGIPMSDIYKKCNQNGIMLNETECCLVTHGHNDHCLSANKLSQMGIKVFATKPTLERAKAKGEEIIPMKVYNVAKGVAIMPFEVEHDIDGAVGFVIKTQKECVIFINDCKYWKPNLINFKPNYVFIECNYDHIMVYAQYHQIKKDIESNTLFGDDLKEAQIKLKQHERNLNSHMSLHGTLRNLKKLNLRYCQAIFLMHLSDRYANEYRMKNDVQLSTGVKTYVCKKNSGVK